MPVCKILENYNNAEGWKKGDIVDITNPSRLIEEGKVELYDGEIIEEEEVTEEEITEGLESFSWDKLRKMASAAGFYKVGMNREEVIEGLKNV